MFQCNHHLNDLRYLFLCMFFDLKKKKFKILLSRRTDFALTAARYATQIFELFMINDNHFIGSLRVYSSAFLVAPTLSLPLSLSPCIYTLLFLTHSSPHFSPSQ